MKLDGSKIVLYNATLYNEYHITDIFPNVSRGYFMVRREENILPDTTYVVRPYFVTFDGVRIYGNTRTYETGNNGNGMCTTETLHEV